MGAFDYKATRRLPLVAEADFPPIPIPIRWGERRIPTRPIRYDDFTKPKKSA